MDSDVVAVLRNGDQDPEWLRTVMRKLKENSKHNEHPSLTVGMRRVQ